MFLYRSWIERPTYRLRLERVPSGTTVTEALWAREYADASRAPGLSGGECDALARVAFSALQMICDTENSAIRQQSELNIEDNVSSWNQVRIGDVDLRVSMDMSIVFRAQGCLLGQVAGDALGGLVEFQSPREIRSRYPHGVRRLDDGGTWRTLAGQPTDDSEMALALARLLVERGAYNAQEAMRAYVSWLESSPFDCGNTVSMGLAGSPNRESQANGALMRISPLGIFGAQKDLGVVAGWAEQDASLTHPHPVCLEANALFAMAIALAVGTGISAPKLYEQVVSWAKERKSNSSIREAIDRAANSFPTSYTHQQGWVLIAFQNGLWQLLHAPNLEEGVVDTVMRGGDTDTNAAIAGALLGAVYGKQAVPEQWTESILSCRPHLGAPGVLRPRPPQYWPVDTLELAARLVAVGSENQAC